MHGTSFEKLNFASAMQHHMTAPVWLHNGASQHKYIHPFALCMNWYARNYCTKRELCQTELRKYKLSTSSYVLVPKTGSSRSWACRVRVGCLRGWQSTTAAQLVISSTAVQKHQHHCFVQLERYVRQYRRFKILIFPRMRGICCRVDRASWPTRSAMVRDHLLYASAH